MEQSHSLILNEAALAEMPDPKKPLFVHEWLRFLDKILPVTQKNDIKGSQTKLVEQLTAQLTAGVGSSSRPLLARCLATLFCVGDTYSLFQTINTCNDLLKSKDDSPSQLPIKLAAISCIGAMYEKLGRMVGRSFEETAQLLVKSLKSAEIKRLKAAVDPHHLNFKTLKKKLNSQANIKSDSQAQSQGRSEIMTTFGKMAVGLGAAGSSIHKDLYKATRPCLTDRTMCVRVAAAQSMCALLVEAPFVYQSELEAVASSCFKSLEGANYECRCAVAKLLGRLLAYAHQPPQTRPQQGRAQPNTQTTQTRVFTLEDCFSLLAAGFLRGGVGFLKGNSGMTANLSREIRIGVTQAYVEFARSLGAQWLERNVSQFIRAVLDVTAVPGRSGSAPSSQGAHGCTIPPITQPHLEAVYIRRCCSFILQATIGRMLGEKAQIGACKELGFIVAEHMNQLDCSVDTSDRHITADTIASEHVLVCALGQLSRMVLHIGTAVTPLFVEAAGIMEPVFAVLLHPLHPARLAAAWCLRSVTIAVPSLLTPLIDRCLSRLEHMKASADAISGYSTALAALVSACRYCPLGIPHTKGKQVFAVADDLLRTASQSSRIALVKTQSAWMLFTAVMTLGPSVVRPFVPRLQLLWKNALPRSAKEAEADTKRGDVFTWSVTLETRAGALAVMHSFCANCGPLLTDDVLRRVIGPIDSCLAMLTHMPNLLRYYGGALRLPVMHVRLRLYGVLMQLKPKYYESCFSSLLRELVADLTMADGGTLCLPTSLTASYCHQLARTLLGTWLHDTDNSYVLEQLHPLHASGCGALEHDPYQLLLVNAQSITGKEMSGSSADGGAIGEALPPEPLPMAIGVIDAALLVYAQIYPLVPNKHRLQMFDHFGECIRTAKAARQQAVQLNVYTSMIVAFKSLAEHKMKLEGEPLQKVAVHLLMPHLCAQNPLLRVAAAECLGRLAQVVVDAQFVAAMAQFSFDKLKCQRDALNRTGHSLALGCLHRYVGSLGSGQHLNTSVSILLALAEDATSPVVQVWSLLALSLIADTGGPMFRGYVEPTLSCCLKLLLNTPHSVADVAHGVGKLVSALITTVGPELQQTVGQIVSTRGSLLVVCAMLCEHADPVVQAEAVGCYQQLHLFAPRYVQLDELVTLLCRLLVSEHLVLRKASVLCLRQLVQREAREVREHAQSLVAPVSAVSTSTPWSPPNTNQSIGLPETGLEGALYHLLDVETDPVIIGNMKETLVSLVQATAGNMLAHWLALNKDILAATSSDLMSPTADEQKQMSASAAAAANSDKTNEDVDDDDDGDMFGGGTTRQHVEGVNTNFALGGDMACYSRVMPRWRTRVFAAEVVRRVIALCEHERAHYDLALAKELQMSGGKNDYLVLHLSDLVRMAFMAATAENTQLRLAGLTCLQEVITRFASVPEPEFAGHVILEQFQAQVGAALRPAFAAETPSHVTAQACQVCSTWIGSGVARDLNDLRRVHQLLVSSLAKLKRGSISTQLYSESAATLEKLSVLKAWAEVYIVAIQQSQQLNNNNEQTDEDAQLDVSESLLSLVSPELCSLVHHWLAALRDSALLSLPTEFNNQLPSDGGAYYTPETADSCRQHYRACWPQILLACTTWLSANDFELPATTSTANQNDEHTPAAPVAPNMQSKSARYYLILGTCLECLCSWRQAGGTSSSVTTSASSDVSDETLTLCLKALKVLHECEWSRAQLMRNVSLPSEILSVMHRLILTRDSLSIQTLCMEVVDSILVAAHHVIAGTGTSGQDDNTHAIAHINLARDPQPFIGNEGGDTGDLHAQTSLATATLEVIICVLVRQLPAISPSSSHSAAVASLRHRRFERLPTESHLLIQSATRALTQLPSLCSHKGQQTLMGTALVLVLGVIRECSHVPPSDNIVPPQLGHVSTPTATALHALRTLLTEGDQCNQIEEEQLRSEVVDEWKKTVCAALVSTLNMHDEKVKDEKAASNDEKPMVDPCIVLVTAAVFLVATPTIVSSNSALRQRAIRLFDDALKHDSKMVQHKGVQTLASIFAHKHAPLALNFIQRLAPKVLGLVKRHFKMDSAKDSCIVQVVGVEDAQDVAVLQECLKCLQIVVSRTDESRRLALVSLNVQLLVNLLCPDAPKQYRLHTQHQRSMHDFAINALNKFGPLYPVEFKLVLAEFIPLKARLESALLHDQQRRMSAAQHAAIQNQALDLKTSTSTTAPAIQLKMDFSAFGAATKKEVDENKDANGVDVEAEA